MDEFDRRIAELLAEEDIGLPQDAREPGFFSLAFSTMRGPQGWVTWVMLIMQTAMFLVALWAAWNFFAATEELSAIKWGFSAATLMIVATQMKLSLMPHMQANRVILALRRLELRLAAKP